MSISLWPNNGAPIVKTPSTSRADAAGATTVSESPPRCVMLHYDGAMETAGQSPLAQALLRLEETHDRLLLAQTRMAMATERAERAVGALSSALLNLDPRLPRPDNQA